MTPPSPDPRATAVAEQLLVEMNYPHSPRLKLRDAFADLISAALADAKREALEEAAQIAEGVGGALTLNAYDMRWTIVQTLRSKATEAR